MLTCNFMRFIAIYCQYTVPIKINLKTLALVQEKFKNKSKFLFWNNTKPCKHKTKILPITTCIKVIHMHNIAYMYKVMSVPSFNKNFPKNIGTVLETFTAVFFDSVQFMMR